MANVPYASLVVAGQIELLGGPNGVPSVNPRCLGATFHLQPGFDLNAPQPTTDYVGSLILDGQRPFGRRAANRTITLPLQIQAPDFTTLAAAVEFLLETIDQQTWQLTWTRASTPVNSTVSYPLVLECFRALPSQVQWGGADQYNISPVAQLTVSFVALPYGHSDLPVQLAFASPIVGGAAVPSPPAPIVLDNYSSLTSLPQWSQSVQCITGPHSAHWDPSVSPASNPTGTGLFPLYTKSFGSVNLTGLTALSLWIGLGSDFFWNVPEKLSVTFSFTLLDSHGNTLACSVTKAMQASNFSTSPKWTKVSVALPASSTFDFTTCVGYTLSANNRADWSGLQMLFMHCYLDALTAVPPTASLPASIRGFVYQLYAALGTSHAPVALQFQQPAISAPSVVVLTGSGTWIPPAGVSTVQVECLGGGGAGASVLVSGLGGGGGGAEYAAEPSYSLSNPAPIAYSCGAGGLATGTGASTALFTNPGTIQWTAPQGVTSIKAECWGGGGGGAQFGGGGGGGEYAAEAALTVVPGTSYTITVGSGGNGSSGRGAQAGTASKFDGTVTAHGGGVTSDGGGGSASGGSGSSNTTHHSGGAGGTSSYFGAGGGGGGSGGSGSAGNAGGNSSSSTGASGGALVTNGGPGGAGGNYYGGSGVTPATGPGGGGGGSGGGTGGAGFAGQVLLTWTVAGGAPVNGGNTTFGTVTAHGGTSAATNSATGGAGGTGSSATTHHNGGAGWSTTALGGGGGSSAGSASVGTAATSQAGAIPPAGGGKGGAGATGANTSGSPGFTGGGGGGADSTSGPGDMGGAGGAGQITLTYTATLAPFQTLIAHRPGPDAPPSLTPFVSTTNVTDPPDGREYSVPSLVPGVNAVFGGTYSVVLVNFFWDTPASSRTITVTVHQYEYQGGPSYLTSVTRTLTPSTDTTITNGFVVMGEMTLPGQDIAADNSQAFFTVSITDTDTSDQFLDVLFLDTMGQTVMLNSNTTPYVNFFIDVPRTDRDLGRVMGSAFDRAEAVSVLQNALVSGGPLVIYPGDNILLGYCIEGAPAIAATYCPRWFLDRTQ